MDADSRQQAQDWASEVSTRVLGWTWQAFDALRRNVLSRIDLNQPLEQLERDLTSKHFIEIQHIFATETDGLSSIVPHHEFPENQARPGGKGRPPSADISFVWYENQRVSWPIEAKVVPTPGTLAQYVSDTAKFTRGVAAPFVGEGAQIAYLLSGVATEFFAGLSQRLALKLQVCPEFSDREHCSSDHSRQDAPYLRIHHMVMVCAVERTEVMLPGFEHKKE